MRKSSLKSTILLAASMFALAGCNLGGETGGDEKPHEHAYSAWEKVDNENHKSVCECGDEKVEAHSYGAVSFDWASDGSSCKASKTCSICAYKFEETGSVTSVEKTPATCETRGTTTYTATFATLGTSTKDIEDIPALNHELSQVSYQWANNGSTCVASQECTREGCEYKVEEIGVITSEIAKGDDATCTAKGYTTYTATFETLGTSTKRIQDVEMKDHSYGNWVPDGDENHKKTCDDCTDVVTAAHSYGQVSYVWADDNSSCTASKTCSVCSHVMSETKSSTNSEKSAAACGVNSWTTYSVDFEKFDDQTKDVENEDALSHVYGTPSYVWNGDKCTATRACTNAGCEQTETEEVTASYSTDSDATHFANEKGHYVATFTKEGFATQTTAANSVEKPDTKIPHDYGETWLKDDENNHKKVCACGDVITEAHSWDNGSVVTKPTHDATGTAEYTCSKCGETQTREIPKIICVDIDLKSPTFDFKTLSTADVYDISPDWTDPDGKINSQDNTTKTVTVTKDVIRSKNYKDTFFVEFVDGSKKYVEINYYSRLISSEEDLRAINTTYLDWYNGLETFGNFKLLNDIEMKNDWTKDDYIGFSDEACETYGEGWTASQDQGFKGIFDGNGHKISNLNIKGADMSSGFIYNLANTGVIQNLTLVGSTDAGSTSSLGRGGLLLAKTSGGLIENVDLTVSFAGNGVDKSHMPTGLLGFAAEKAQSQDITVKNVKIKAGNATTRSANMATALGLNGDDYEYREKGNYTITLENVEITGFQRIWYDGKHQDVTYDTVDSLPAYFAKTNVSFTSSVIKMTVEADRRGYDFSALNESELLSVTHNGSNVELVNGVGQVDEYINKWATSFTADPYPYIATFADGSTYSLDIKVYTFLIKTEDDLFAACNAENIFLYDTPCYTVGYIKLANDIVLTKDWDPSKQIGLVTTENGFDETADKKWNYSYSQGFRGTFDGGGHTISNFNINRTSNSPEICGLIFSLAQDGIVKNLNLEGSTNTGGNTETKGGLLIGKTYAGTIENCTIKVKYTAVNYDKGHTAGALLGFLTDSAYNGQIYVNNCIIIAADNYTGEQVMANPLGSNSDDYSFQNPGTCEDAMIHLNGVKLVGFTCLYYDGKTQVSYNEVADFPSYISATDVVKMTINEYETSLNQ